MTPYDPLIDAVGILEVLRMTLPLLPASQERNDAWTTLDNAAKYLIRQGASGPAATGCDCLRPGGCAACSDFYNQPVSRASGEDVIYALDKLDAVESYLQGKLAMVNHPKWAQFQHATAATLNRAIDLIAIARDEVTR